jgi:hypothetical protein
MVWNWEKLQRGQTSGQGNTVDKKKFVRAAGQQVGTL